MVWVGEGRESTLTLAVNHGTNTSESFSSHAPTGDLDSRSSSVSSVPSGEDSHSWRRIARLYEVFLICFRAVAYEYSVGRREGRAH